MIGQILLALAGTSLFLASQADGKKIFCYFSSFAQTRPGKGKFLPENIDPYLCTHIIFAFVDITRDGTDLKTFNWNDVGNNGLYKRTIALKEKNPKLKVLLAVGGWSIGSKPFIPMISSKSRRHTWVKNVITYLRKHSFDGFDMDWEFPATRGSPPDDKYRFTLLMKELYESFAQEARETNRDKLLLTLATAAGTYYISQSYEPTEIVKYVDFMFLMTYNYHGGAWEQVTGHHAGLYRHKNDPPGEKGQLYQQWSIDFWLDAGIPKTRLVVGIPTYGMTFRLADSSQHDVFAPAIGGGTKGEYTGERGIMSYYEVCERLQERGWKSKWIDSQAVPYAYGGDQWVGYENKDSIRLKAKNILKRDLAGAFVWSVEMDDFGGTCGEGKYPLMSEITKILKPYNGMRKVETNWTPKPTKAVVWTQKPKPSWRPTPTEAKPKWKPKAEKPKSKPKPKWTPKVTSRPAVREPEKPSWNKPWTEKGSWKKSQKKKPSWNKPQQKPSWEKPKQKPSWEKPKQKKTWQKPHEEKPSWQKPKYEKPKYEKPKYEKPSWQKPTWRPRTKSPSAAGSVDCSKLGSGIFADPSSCDNFYLCVPGVWGTYQPVRMACPTGTRFDDALRICNHENSIECWT